MATEPVRGALEDYLGDASSTEPRRDRWRAWALGLAFVTGILLVNEFAYRLAVLLDDGKHVTTIWPHLGFALGFVLRFGRQYWPALLIGNALAQLRFGFPPLSYVVCVTLDTLYPVVVTTLLDRWCRFDRRLSRTRDVLWLGFGAGLVGFLPIAVIESMSYSIDIAAPTDLVASAAFACEWWLESVMGVLVVTPLFLVVHFDELRLLPRIRRIEGLSLMVAAFFVTFAMYESFGTSHRFGHLVSLVAFPLAMLAAFRFGKAGSALFALSCAIGAMLGRAGPAPGFEITAVSATLVDQTAFLVIVALFGLVMATMLLRRIGTELLLASTEASFRSLFEHSPIGIAIERAGAVRFVNRALLEVLGHKSSEALIGATAEDWIETGSGTRGDHGREVEALCKRPDGSKVDVWLSEATIPQPDGVEIVRFVIDRSDEKQLEQELHRARRLESVGLLAGGIAHDFNNLLTVIAGYVDLLRETTPRDSDAAQPLEQVATATEKASTLTRQLLAFGRQKGGVAELVDVTAKVRELAPILRRLAGEHVEIVLDLAPDLERVVLDPVHIDQILLNLVTNSRDAMPNGGRIVLRTRALVIAPGESRRGELKSGAYVVLEVSDTGSGMDAETQRRAFDPFFTTKAAGKGHGLGLATVRALVDSIGAQVRIRSQIGSGTMITVAIPIPADARPAPAAGAPPSGVPKPNASILVVQEDPALRGLIVQVLLRERYEVRAASSVSEALELIASRDGAFDLLLTDVMMPRMSGADLANCVRKHWPMIRCVFLAGYSEPELLAIRSEIPAADLLSKPFTTAQLLERVRSALSIVV